jgi:hypothetical protein
MLSVKQVPKCLGKVQTLERLGDDDDENNETAVEGSGVVAAENRF